MRNWIQAAVIGTMLALALCAQQRLPGLMQQRTAPPPQTQRPNSPAPVAPAPSVTAPQQEAPAPAATITPASSGKFILNLNNASLTDVIDSLARQLKINYILDPRVKGAVSVNTYGELREVDIRALLDTILRVNGFAMVQVGDLFRIVPLTDVSRLPLRPMVNNQTIPADEQVSLNLVFLKYATVGEISKLLDKFVGEGATMITYDPANLLLILDNNRNMRRTMELISLFDSDTLASQRVRLFEVTNGSPTAIVKDLETIFRSISLGEKTSPVKFMALDRINTIIAVAPNPGVFDTVEMWLRKLDVRVETTVGAVDNHVYRVKYGQADVLASAIMQLYLGMYGYGMGGSGMGSYPGAGYPAMGNASLTNGRQAAQPNPRAGGTGATTGTQPGTQTGAPSSPFDLTGSYLGGGYGSGFSIPEGMPRIVPNPMDNTVLIQATLQEYEKILKLLKDLDVAPRQVLIEAKIYEVVLTGAFQSGVTAYLQRRGTNDLGAPSSLASLSTRTAQAGSSALGVVLTAGTLVGQSRELLGILTASEDNRKTKVISAPVIIATDSIPAYINVGQEVPTLSSQALTGAQAGGNSLFANTIQNRNSGVTLNVTARVNPSGIVTLVINQEISSPQAPSASDAIQSPSFSTRSLQTQVTVQDGDTIAIGGIIRENDTSSSAGIPLLHRIPIIGGAFGAKSTTKERTELVVFMTPRVIYDTNAMVEASDELKSKLKRLTKIMQD